MRFVKTVDLSTTPTSVLLRLQRGQWVQLNGVKGIFCGVGSGSSVIVCWVSQPPMGQSVASYLQRMYRKGANS